jgi:type VI secretion system protein ImpD
MLANAATPGREAAIGIAARVRQGALASLASDASLRIDRLIVAIDRKLSQQVNAIIHHPEFQAMEARWRQLSLLVGQARDASSVRVMLFSVSWRELTRDIERAAEFDQSRLFRLIYSDEFDMPGGQPFGLLVGDFEIRPSPSTDHPTDDIGTLEGVARVAAAAFCPFVCSAHPSLLGLDEFVDLDRQPDLSATLDKKRSPRWNRLRASLDARFLGLTLPRVLVRAPYAFGVPNRNDGFAFRERLAADGSNLLWGNSSFAFAGVVVREFIASGWFADLRGARDDQPGGGLVDMYAPLVFPTDKHGFASQPPVDIRLTVEQEQSLAIAGFVPLAPAPYTASLVFNSNGSLHEPPRYETEIATQNARISAMLQYVLCACRFAHYIKLIMRESVGKVLTFEGLRRQLNNWLAAYCIGNDDAEESIKARHPLRSADVEVREIPGQPGVFKCIIHLQPHFQVDDVSASFQLLADMNSAPRPATGEQK